MDASHVADEVVTAGTALSGLILLFIGNLAIDFEKYPAEARRTVRPRLQRRGWFAFVGFAAAILSVFSALAYDYTESACLIAIGVAFLIIALLISLGVGLLAVLDIG